MMLYAVCSSSQPSDTTRRYYYAQEHSQKKSDPKDFFFFYSLFWFLYLGKCFMLHLGFVLKQTQRHIVKTEDLVPYEHGNLQINVLLVENI